MASAREKNDELLNEFIRIRFQLVKSQVLAQPELLEKADLSIRRNFHVTEIVAQLPFCDEPGFLRRRNRRDFLKWVKFVNGIKRIPRVEDEAQSSSDTDAAPETDSESISGPPPKRRA